MRKEYRSGCTVGKSSISACIGDITVSVFDLGLFVLLPLSSLGISNLKCYGMNVYVLSTHPFGELFITRLWGIISCNANSVKWHVLCHTRRLYVTYKIYKEKNLKFQKDGYTEIYICKLHGAVKIVLFLLFSFILWTKVH